jgi:hypothetical protein
MVVISLVEQREVGKIEDRRERERFASVVETRAGEAEATYLSYSARTLRKEWR